MATGTLSGVTSVSLGSYSTCATLSTGGVDCWGFNASGQLGNNTTTQEPAPVAVVGVSGSGTLSGVTSVSTDDSSTCATLSTGGVDCWGDNNSGQLGNNTTTSSETPVAVVGVNDSGTLSGVASASVGSYSACATLTTTGVDCWGFNNNGQLGNNTTTNSETPVEVVGVSDSGTLSGVASASVGYEATCAMLTLGGVDCWGLNNEGQLGNTTTTNSETPVAVAFTTPQTLTLSPSTTTAGYGDSVQLSLAAPTGSGTVSYNVVSAGDTGCLVSGSGLVTASAAGTCTINVTITADSVYAAATSNTSTITFSSTSATPSWTRSTIDSGDGGLTGVSCGSSTFCMAVDIDGYALNYNGSSWSSPSLIDSGYVLTGVSCVVGSTFCMAVDDFGHAC